MTIFRYYIQNPVLGLYKPDSRITVMIVCYSVVNSYSAISASSTSKVRSLKQARLHSVYYCCGRSLQCVADDAISFENVSTFHLRQRQPRDAKSTAKNKCVFLVSIQFFLNEVWWSLLSASRSEAKCMVRNCLTGIHFGLWYRHQLPANISVSVQGEMGAARRIGREWRRLRSVWRFLISSLSANRKKCIVKN